MLAMIVYVLIVGVLLSAAALIAEYAAKQRGTSRRWIWMTTIIASLLLPLIIPNVTIQVPDLIKPANTEKSFALRDVTSVHVPMAFLDLGMPNSDSFGWPSHWWCWRDWYSAAACSIGASVFG
jgi:bla regulator protein BlaR1